MTGIQPMTASDRESVEGGAGVTPLGVFGHAVGMALTDRKVPEDWDTANLTPAQVLAGTIALLDKLDDATDAFVAAMGSDHLVDRAMQRDLRLAADTLDSLTAERDELRAALAEIKGVATDGAAMAHLNRSGIMQDPPHDGTFRECQAPWCVRNREHLVAARAALSEGGSK